MSRILIAEDERATAHLLSKVLGGAGYEVQLVSDGVAALDALRGSHYDLILLDVWMPKLSGREVLGVMRTENLGTRAVVMTSDGTPETVLCAVRDQAYHYLSKPVKPAELLDLVKKTLTAQPVAPVEVVSARPDWVELLLPCHLEVADRIHGLLSRLLVDLPEQMRDDIGYGSSRCCATPSSGRWPDPNRKVRHPARAAWCLSNLDPGPGLRWKPGARRRELSDRGSGRARACGRRGAFGLAASAF